MKLLNDDDKEVFQALAAAAETAKGKMPSIMSRIANARRTFAQSPSDEAHRLLKQAEEEGAVVNGRLHDTLERMAALLELSDDDIQLIESAQRTGDSPPRYSREQLTADRIESDDHVDALLERTYESLLRLMPVAALDKYRTLDSGAPWLMRTSGLLSIVKGVVPESERPNVHRFAQCIGVSQALLTSDSRYDMFAGAILVPQIARLADRLEVLAEIPGAMKRVRSLWHGPSKEVDSTMFELLVAGGCAMEGRSVEFLEPQGGKTPDLRCHDPYPLVIECKRKQVLTEYEITEERAMRELFQKLESGARAVGMWGAFKLFLSVESKTAPIDEIVLRLLEMRLAGAGQSVIGPWGEATYTESARLVNIGGNTRMYSPVMLNAIFAWNSDLAEWDGLICRVGNYTESVVNIAEEPVGLLWVNSSGQAIKKRSWGPMSTLNEAIEQIPPGDFGVPYIAYQEGARSPIADMRTFNFSDWIKGSSHPANIRVPFGRIIRLYPRPLNHGAPDLIESSMTFVPEYADNVLPTMFPSNVIVR